MAGSPIGAGLEVRIAETALAAFRDEHDLAGARHVADGRPGLLIEDRGADRDPNVEYFPVATGLFATAAIGSILCPVAWSRNGSRPRCSTRDRRRG